MAGDITYVKEKAQRATATRLGLIKLAGDLGGTADAPRVVSISPSVTISLAGGGTNADLSSTGPGVLVQTSSGADVTVETLDPSRGGTGINNGSRTLTIATNSGTLAFSAASKTLTVAQSLTLTGASGKTLTLTDSLTVQGGGTTTLSSAGNYTLIIPTTGTAALRGTDNNFTAGQTIKASSVSNVPLTLDGATGQTADLQQWSVNGAEKASVDKDGRFYRGDRAIDEGRSVSVDGGVWHFDGPEPYATNYSGTLASSRGTLPSTVSGGVIHRPGKFGKGVQIAEATTNLVTNPSFETNTSGWSSQGANTYSRSLDYAKFGSYSAKTTREDSGNSVVLYSSTLTLTATTYTATAYIYIPESSDCNAAHFRFEDFSGATNSSYDTVYTKGEWVRVHAQITIDAGDLTGFLVLRSFAGTLGSNATCYIDGIQLEQKPYATPYCDGSLGLGNVWDVPASPHASTSSRTKTEISYTNSIVSTAGTLMLYWQPSTGYATQPDSYLFDEGSISIWWDNSAAKFTLEDGTNTVLSAAQTFSAGSSIHLAATWTGSTLTLYVNGVATSGTYTAITPGATMYLGADTAGANQANGIIDDLILLDRAAEADEIRAIYESDAPVTTEKNIGLVFLGAMHQTPNSPPSDNGANWYLTDDGKIVAQYNDGGIVRYKYLDLTGTGVTWTHSTTAP